MALTLAVGLVVDDAIVMLENIFRYLEQGDDRLTAALKGAGEIGFTIVSITVSLIDRKSTRLNSSHSQISYAVFCLKKKTKSSPAAHPRQPVAPGPDTDRGSRTRQCLQRHLSLCVGVSVGRVDVVDVEPPRQLHTPR